MRAQYLFAFIMSAGLAFGQTSRDLSITYSADGRKTIVDNDGKEQVTLTLRSDGLATFYEIDVIGDSRVIRYNYSYDANNRLAEVKDYSSGNGYRKTTNRYDSRGFLIEVSEYETKNEHVDADWVLSSRRSHQYDQLGRQTRFEFIGYPGRLQIDFDHRLTEYTYAGTTTKNTQKNYEYDASGRILRQTVGSGNGSFQSPTNENIVQDHSQGATSVMIVSATNDHKNESYFVEGRMTEDVFYGFKSGSGNVFTTTYEMNYLVQNAYSNGKLTDQIIRDDSGPVVKRSLTYSGDTPTEMKTFYSTSVGSWSLVRKEKFKPALRQFFPALTGNNFSNAVASNVESPVISAAENESASSAVNTPPSHTTSNSLQQAVMLAQTNDGNSSKAEINASTQRLLAHMLTIMNYNSTEKISEADLIELAMKELVEKYRNDLKQLNDAYLSSQQAMFD